MACHDTFNFTYYTFAFARPEAFPVMINEHDDKEKNHQSILDDDDDDDNDDNDDDVLTFRQAGEGISTEEEREKEKERAERGIFISIRFFLVISHNALSLLSTCLPHQSGSGSGHMPEPIIIEKESLDDLNHANRSPCLRAGQSRRPISNNGFQRCCAKLGNVYCSTSEKTIIGNEPFHIHNHTTDRPK